MKKFFINLFFIFSFILCFALQTFAAADLNINSVVYDNSASFLTVNSYDNDTFSFSAQPKLYILKEQNKAYFDINSALLKCSGRDLVVNSPEIKEIFVNQFSTNPNVVRVVIIYNNGYNPENIQLRRINNTFFVRFKTPVISNYYFEQIYAETGVPEFFESAVIQSPVAVSQNSVLNQINSAFKPDASADKNYVLAKRNLELYTKYYLDNITLKNNDIVVTGIGSLTLSKPVYLSNPSRVVYDITNAFVNSSVRNKEFKINQTDTVKIGQFNRNTARIVITSANPEKYFPVIYSDLQRLVFRDKTLNNSKLQTSGGANLTSAYDDITDLRSHSMKLVFSKPIIIGIERSSTSLDLLLYNVEKYDGINLKTAFVTDDIKLVPNKDGGVKLTVPTEKGDAADVYLGGDGKTLRINMKCAARKLPEVVTTPAIVVEPVFVQKSSGKKCIVIDPGHGGSDVGATRNGIYEKDITLDVSKRAAALLEAKGYTVKMTRTADDTVSLQERVDFSEGINPDIFVSIHVNSSNSETPNGIETHYYKDNSLKLAKNIHAALLNNINANDRGLFKSKFYVINHTTAPAVLVEIGFISNPSERAQLVSESRKQATAKAIVEGIYDYFK